MKDKEKRIANSWRAKMVENGIYKDSETTSKEMIEEMAKVIRNANAMNCFGENCDNCKYSWHEHCNSIMQATSVFNAGYRKLPKDSVVLSKEEYKKLKMLEEGHITCEDVLEFVEKARKETAEKYKVAMILCIQEMQKYLEITEEQAKILYQHNAEIAKQFDEEMKND